MTTMNTDRPKPVYSCSQQSLYTLIETGWGSCAHHLSDFSNYKTFYTQAMIDEQLLALKAARQMPDEASREEVHKTLRKRLQGLAVQCLVKWSNLDGYIEDAFDEESYADKRNAAGHGYYRGAQQDDWESVNGLMTSGELFITDNATVLGEDGGMPATFPGAFNLLKVDFETLHQAFLQAEEDAKALTDAKVEANNVLYRKLMKMFKDGQRVFRLQAAIREQFVMERVLELINGGSGGGVPSNQAGFGGLVSDSVTGEAVVGATVRLTFGTQTVEVLTTATGRFNLLSGVLASAMTGTMTVTHPNYHAASEPVGLVLGERGVRNFALIPVVGPEEPAVE